MRIIIVANGQLYHPELLKARLRTDDFIIAADGGAQHCLALELKPDIVIGDLDSLSKEQVAELKANGCEIHEYASRKDQTDLELALLHALSLRPDEIGVYGALGLRWDHSLANLLIAAMPQLAGIPIVFYAGYQRIYPVFHSTTIEGNPGDIVSLIPIGGTAHGVTTDGLEYGLENGSLPFGSTLGVSNILLGTYARVSLEMGQVLCIVVPHDQIDALR